MTDTAGWPKALADGSIRFKFYDGPCDGWTMRLYPPIGDTKYPPYRDWPESLYKLTPPTGRRRSWHFVYAGPVSSDTESTL